MLGVNVQLWVGGSHVRLLARLVQQERVLVAALREAACCSLRGKGQTFKPLKAAHSAPHLPTVSVFQAKDGRRQRQGRMTHSDPIREMRVLSELEVFICFHQDPILNFMFHMQ